MNQLVGEDAVVDNEFWKMDLFKDEEEDEEYSSEEEEEDVVDADFDKPEEADEPEEREGDGEEKEKKRKRAGEYVDPKSKKALQKAQKPPKKPKLEEDEAYEEISSSSSEESQPTSPITTTTTYQEEDTPTPSQPRKSSRTVALARAAERQKERQELEKKKALRPKKRAQIVVRRLTQEELLAEAKITERINRESLKDFLLIEEEKRRVKELPAYTGPMIHYHSKNGITTVTFPNLPPVLSQSPSSPPTSNNAQQLTCPITGLPAKYRDPKTGSPYATMQAFKLIRDRFLQKEEARCDARLLELSILLDEKKRKKEVVSLKRKELEVALAAMTTS